jgi:H+/Cl- antiporter ClcA
MGALMVACNVGVTKTPLGSVLVVTEMAGLTLLPSVLIASVVALLLTSHVGLIDSQRRRADTSSTSDEEERDPPLPLAAPEARTAARPKHSRTGRERR